MKDNQGTAENKVNETKRVIVMKKRESKKNESNSVLNESFNKENKDTAKDNNLTSNSYNDKGKSEMNNSINNNESNQNSTWDDFFEDKNFNDIKQDPDKIFYNSNYSQNVKAKQKKPIQPSGNENQPFSNQMNLNSKSSRSSEKYDNKPNSLSKGDNINYDDKKNNELNHRNEGDYSEDEKLGRSIDSPKINKHIVSNANHNKNDGGYNGNQNNQKNSFNRVSEYDINYDYDNDEYLTDSSLTKNLNNNANKNNHNINTNSKINDSSSIDNNRNNYKNQKNSLFTGENKNRIDYNNNLDYENSFPDANVANKNLNQSNKYYNNTNNNQGKKYDFNLIKQTNSIDSNVLSYKNNRNNSYNNSGSLALSSMSAQRYDENMPQTSDNNQDVQQKEKKLLNKLSQYILNFERWQFDVIFSKHLNIDVELIGFDLIKKFEEELRADKILLRDLALDMFEFYPKMKSYWKFKNGNLKHHQRNPHPKHMFLKKLDDLSPLFEGVVKDDIFVDNFIFFEPLAQFIKENISMHRKNVEISRKVLNFNKPENFFPEARSMKRKFVYHMGPTNSGKTSNALERLAKAESGIYLAPLRLLAWEIYEKLSQKGVKCTLLTGQDRVLVDNETHYSMTIEKCDFRRRFEVAVIDEIQMIEDYERGSAWTNAVLGVQADEIHLCGDERGFYLLKQLCEKTGDELFFKKYSRFSNLIVEQNTFNYSDLRKGDCIIAFAKTKIMEIKRRIVDAKNGDLDCCAVIYGDLPSETKKDQAKMFNELTFSTTHNSEVKYDYLVASDAVNKLKYIINQQNYIHLQL